MIDCVTNTLRVAVVRFSALGDVVMVAAAVRALQLSMPNAKVTWFTSPSAYALLNGMKEINFEIVEKPRSIADYRKFYRTYAIHQFDVVLAMQASLRINLLYPALRAPIKIGFDRTRAREGQWLFCNRHITFSNTHLVDSFLSFIETLIGKPASAIWELPLDENSLHWAGDRLQSLPKPWVAIHPCTSKKERNWIPERYVETVAQIDSRWHAGIMLTGSDSPAEQALCELIARHAPESTLNLCGKTTPKQLAALLSLADVLIAPDTGVVHIARALDTPVIGLYAVASPKLTGPYQRYEHCVDRYPQAVQEFLGRDQVDLPWNTRVHHPGAMSLITVDDVMQQLESVLGQHK